MRNHTLGASAHLVSGKKVISLDSSQGPVRVRMLYFWPQLSTLILRSKLSEAIRRAKATKVVRPLEQEKLRERRCVN